MMRIATFKPEKKPIHMRIFVIYNRIQSNNLYKIEHDCALRFR